MQAISDSISPWGHPWPADCNAKVAYSYLRHGRLNILDCIPWESGYDEASVTPLNKKELILLMQKHDMQFC